ncbi:hypothetical protein L7F22_011443 [Adiantum nelumboides]|nr:hypothetical protein [Adiantum nelumboides]
MITMMMMMWATWEGASAVTWAVGDSAGWVPMDYESWIKDKAFREGDILYFEYNEGAHDVVEVSKDDYDACHGSHAIRRWINGNTSVTLTGSMSTHYFLCSFVGHCPPMKLVIHVLPALVPLSTSVSSTPNTTNSLHTNQSSSLKSIHGKTFITLMATSLFAWHVLPFFSPRP